MAQHRFRTPRRALPATADKPHAESCLMIRRIIDEVFGGSHASVADDTGIHISQVYRIATGERAAATGHIAALIKALPAPHAQLGVELMAAWLQECADAAHKGFSVSVESAHD